MQIDAPLIRYLYRAQVSQEGGKARVEKIAAKAAGAFQPVLLHGDAAVDVFGETFTARRPDPVIERAQLLQLVAAAVALQALLLGQRAVVALPVGDAGQVEDRGLLHQVWRISLAFEHLRQKRGLRHMIEADRVWAAAIPDLVEDQAAEGWIEAGGIIKKGGILVHWCRQRHQNTNGGAYPARHQRPDHQAFGTIPEDIDLRARAGIRGIRKECSGPVQAPVGALEIGEGFRTAPFQVPPGFL